MIRNQEIKEVWTDEYKIHSYEIDVRGAATLPILCKFMQESAWHHAEHLGVGYSHLIEKNLIWVLSQQLIRMYFFPKWGETIQIHTWPSGKGRLSYHRDFKLLDRQNRTIGIATTIWYAIDLLSRRPQSLGFDFHLDDCEHVFSHKLNKLRSLNSTDGSKSFQVGYSDLDVNEHVNNIRYIEWILESFTLDYQKSHTLKEIEIKYLAEALYDDKLSVGFKKGENLTYYHHLVRDENHKELCRARTQWDVLNFGSDR